MYNTVWKSTSLYEEVILCSGVHWFRLFFLFGIDHSFFSSLHQLLLFLHRSWRSFHFLLLRRHGIDRRAVLFFVEDYIGSPPNPIPLGVVLARTSPLAIVKHPSIFFFALETRLNDTTQLQKMLQCDATRCLRSIVSLLVYNHSVFLRPRLLLIRVWASAVNKTSFCLCHFQTTQKWTIFMRVDRLSNENSNENSNEVSNEVNGNRRSFLFGHSY